MKTKKMVTKENTLNGHTHVSDSAEYGLKIHTSLQRDFLSQVPTVVLVKRGCDGRRARVECNPGGAASLLQRNRARELVRARVIISLAVLQAAQSRRRESVKLLRLPVIVELILQFRLHFRGAKFKTSYICTICSHSRAEGAFSVNKRQDRL